MEILSGYKKAAVGAFREYRCVIIPSLISALLSYGFAMTNMIVNWDGARMLEGLYGAGIGSGRWLLWLMGEVSSRLWGGCTLPLLNGALASLLLTLSACVLVRTLGIKNGLLAAAVGAVFVTFPAAGGMMLYMYTAHYYALSVLVALSGARCAERLGWRGVLPGAVLIACSLGIYQAYLPLAAAVLVLSLLRRSFEAGEKTRAVGSRAGSYAVTLLLGILIYTAILWALLLVSGRSLTDYQGIGSAGASLTELPRLFIKAYGSILLLPFRARYGVNDTVFIRAAIFGAFVLSLLLFTVLFLFCRAGAGRRALQAVIFALLPPVFGSVELLSSGTYVHTLMTYASVGVFAAPVMLSDIMLDEKTVLSLSLPKSLGSRRAAECAGVAAAVLVFLSAANYICQSNGNYLEAYYADEQAKEYFTTLITRIKSVDGFDDDKKLAVIGGTIDDGTYENAIYAGLPFRYSGTPNSLLNSYSRDYFMLHYHGFSMECATEEELIMLSALDEVRSMPCYPDDGSISVIGDFVVLKLEEP